MTIEEMRNKYNEFSAVHNYCVGFTANGNVYYALVTFDEIRSMLKITQTSAKVKGGTPCKGLRFQPNKSEITTLMKKAVYLCTEIYFNSVLPNKGEAFEKLIVEKVVHAEWKRNKTEFYISGDATINGIDTQIKFLKASFSNENCLNSLKKVNGKTVKI